MVVLIVGFTVFWMMGTCSLTVFLLVSVGMYSVQNNIDKEQMTPSVCDLIITCFVVLILDA